MIWDDQKKKDMELYPLVEPIINYTSDKFNNFFSGTHRVASNLTKIVKNGGRRLEDLKSGDTIKSPSGSKPDSKDK